MRLFTDDVRITTRDEAAIDVGTCCALCYSTTLAKNSTPPHTHFRVILHVGESVRVVLNVFLCFVPGFHLRLPNTIERTFSSKPKCVRVTCFCFLTTCRDAFKCAATAHGFYIPHLIVLTSCSGAWKEQRAKS